MTNKLKFLTVLSVIFCLTIFLGITANAETYGVLTYEVTDGEVTITDCDESTSIVVIPENINGYPVTAIGKSAFYYSDLSNITIPNSIATIGDYAFYGCSDMANIIIPDSVTHIGQGAFASCQGLKTITIPNSITTIANKTFEYCTKLKNITIPNSVSYIGDYAFDHCWTLSNIDIPYGVTYIGSSAFNGCNKLNSITIPNTVTTIGAGCFWYCFELTSLTIPDSVTSIGKSILNGCSMLKTIFAPIHLKDSQSIWLTETYATVKYRYPYTVEITNATSSNNDLKFVTKMETTAEEPTITAFGTTFVPLWLYDEAETKSVKVEYSAADHSITNGQSFGATLANIPENCKDMDIVAKSYLILEDGSEIWSAPMYARLSDCTLRNVE